MISNLQTRISFLKTVMEHIEENQQSKQIPDEKRDLIVYAFEHWFDYFDQFDEMEEFIKRYSKNVN